MPYLKKMGFLFLLFLFSFNTYGQNYIGKDKEIQKILKNIANFSQYYMNGEAQKIVDCYTTDGKIFPGRVKVLEGKEELLKYWTVPADVKVLMHKVTPSEIRIVKKTAYDYGIYEGETQRPNSDPSAFKGTYLIVWKKIGKEWKIYLDIWN